MMSAHDVGSDRLDPGAHGEPFKRRRRSIFGANLMRSCQNGTVRGIINFLSNLLGIHQIPVTFLSYPRLEFGRSG
jgi:hypothetical protein